MKQILLENLDRHDEFDRHDSVYEIQDESIGLKAYIAIHRKGKRQVAFGATRLWRYNSDVSAIRDALSLSRTMSYKSYFAGLHYGGAKGVIMENPLLLRNREEAFKKYAEFVNILNGKFITGTDAGLQRHDLKVMAETSKYIVGLNIKPEFYTALGLLYSIEVGLEQIYGTPDIKNRTFSIMGLGKVGLAILEFLYPHAKEIYVSEINSKQLALAKKKYPHIIVVATTTLIKLDVDIFVPCAVGVIISEKNVNLLNCKAIIGGSNNQLEDESVAELLYKRNILYAPDFIVNAGGLISVVHEYEYPQIDENIIHEKLFHIKTILFSIFQESNKTNISIKDVLKKRFETILE